MYVCICNALTEKHIAEVAKSGTSRPNEVFAACRCRAQCGSCVRRILDLVRQHRTGIHMQDHAGETLSALG